MLSDPQWCPGPILRSHRSPGSRRRWSIPAGDRQFGLLVLVIRQLQFESAAFLRVALLALAATAPARLPMP
jgi:hypothetical protein